VLDLSFGAASFVMPNLLAKLDADVLVVNPYAHTSLMMSVDRQANAARVADLVRASGAQLGAVIDPDCEHLTIVDDEGEVLSDDQALLTLLRLVVETHPGATVALPVAASDVAQAICAEGGASIIFTKLSSAHLMEVASEGGVTFAASQAGGFIFPDFLPAYDAATTLVELIALLSDTARRCPSSSTPSPVHIAHESVVTPWEQKGMIMRTLVEQLSDRDLVLVDGVKVPEEDGWRWSSRTPKSP